MDHRAEIRFPPQSPVAQPADPSSILVNHHRVESVELGVQILSGGHLFHLALASCIFNNVYRLASEGNIEITEARVIVDGDFDDEGSTGVSCEIELAGSADEEILRALALEAESQSTIGATIRKGTEVTLQDVRVGG
ncbi:MAG: OsmC family protein [Actinomycetota bacterium]